MKSELDLSIDSLLADYRSGALTPAEVVEEVFRRIEAVRNQTSDPFSDQPIWIHLLNFQDVMEQALALEHHTDTSNLPLYGIPFAIKDNIDVAELPTTAGCPAFGYTAEQTATTVQRLQNAGAILIGKTNMDQFATGLVGTRSPYGACHSVYDPRYVSGGSSSGSAVAVASQLVSFSLGTDTAGSGRVPAAFNNLTGFKPSRGALSTAGVVPACRSLDCVSIFAASCKEAEMVFNAAHGFDEADPYSRPFADHAAPWLGSVPRIGVPAASELEFFGDRAAEDLFHDAVDHFSALGCEIVEIDWTPFREAASLLYSGPWVAERLAAIGYFLENHAADMDPTVARIIGGAARYSAVDAYRAAYRLGELKIEADRRWAEMDVLVLPTTGTTYTIEAVAADPVTLNTNLGYYTNFVNLLDLAAVAIPAGFRPNGLPFGITLMGPAFTDRALLRLGQRYAELPQRATAPLAAPGCVTVAVVGAHLTGQPLNHELTSRGARLVKACRTSPPYRLYSLANTKPAKPGLFRDESFRGPGIDIELWSVPEVAFGSFVAAIPRPLGIGKIETEDGELVSGFICERDALSAATEITAFGGWREWRKAQASA